MAKRKTTPIAEVEEQDINKSENCTCAEKCECDECNDEQTQYIATSSNFTYGFEESLAMEDVGSRNLYINGEIDSDTFRHIYYFITRFNAEDAEVDIDKRVPIKLHISTVGGSVWDGLGIVSIIQNSDTPVIGICASYALSMGFYIFLSCDVRYATENAFLLRHEGIDGGYDASTKIKDYLAFSNKLQERLDKIVIRNSSLTARDLQDTERVENYIFADEAKDLGMIDYIIGQDCSLEDIL